jgi:acetamidase/formamidase
VYLPVYALGALLFLGGGHAAPGMEELTGNALVTSMDIEFTVDVQARGLRRTEEWRMGLPDGERHRGEH